MSARFLPCLLVALALAAGAPVFAHEPASVSSAGADIGQGAEDAVRVVDAFSAAIQGGRVDEAAGWLAADLLVLESGGAERSRDQYLAEHAGADAAFLANATVVRGHRLARASGELAWVATESTVTRTGEGKPRRSLGTETMVLRRDGTGWKIVHIHWSSRPGT